MSDITYPTVTVKLSGNDGNAFSIIGQVAKAIRKGVGQEEADTYSKEATSSESYDALLRHAMRTVNVK